MCKTKLDLNVKHMFHPLQLTKNVASKPVSRTKSIEETPFLDSHVLLTVQKMVTLADSHMFLTVANKDLINIAFSSLVALKL